MPQPSKLHPLLTSPRLALALSSLFWSGNFIVGRALREAIPALSLNYWRWLLALLILLPFTWRALRKDYQLLKRYDQFLLFLALTGIVGFHICVYLALQQTTAINALLFLSISPLIILFGSWLSYRTPVTVVQMVGIGVSLLGVLAIITRGELQRILALAFNQGDLWMLLAVTLWSAYSVMLKRKPHDLGPTVLLDGTVLYGVILMTPFYVLSASNGPGFELSNGIVAALIYISVFASVIAYFFWNYGVAQLGPNKAGIYLHLMPLYGALLSILFLGEGLRVYHLLGALFIGGGILLSNYARATVKKS